MSIVQISNNAVANVMPINQPIDDTWRYVFDPLPDIDSRYQVCMGYDYSYDANSNNVTATANIIYLPLDTIKASRYDELADMRYNSEIGGTSVSGIPMPTDRDSQAKITGARVEAQANSSYVVNWKAGDGFVTMNVAMITIVSEGVRAHVQAAFDNEMFHYYNIVALANAEAVIAYDITTGWPS